MMRSVQAGIAKAREIGAQYVVRTRVDQRVMAFDIAFDRLDPMCSIYGFSNRGLFSDSFQYGTVEAMERVWVVPSDKKYFGGPYPVEQGNKQLQFPLNEQFLYIRITQGKKQACEPDALTICLLKPFKARENQRSVGLRVWERRVGNKKTENGKHLETVSKAFPSKSEALLVSKIFKCAAVDI
jgi:hypothetical protein